MGGLWGEALGEQGADRAAGIERRCDILRADLDRARGDRGLTGAALPAGAPEQACGPLRAVEPYVVDATAAEVQARAGRSPGGQGAGRSLVVLLRAVAGASRENVRARCAADVVKQDVAGPLPSTYASDEKAAADALVARSGLDALFKVDAGAFIPEARGVGLLVALDRFEIARGLPEHLAIDAVGGACSDLFQVDPPVVGPLGAAPVPSGTWLAYLTRVAAVAGHPVPDDARDPHHRETLAWNGVLAGFADRMGDAVATMRDTESLADVEILADVELRTAARLDDEFRHDR